MHELFAIDWIALRSLSRDLAGLPRKIADKWSSSVPLRSSPEALSISFYQFHVAATEPRPHTQKGSTLLESIANLEESKPHP